MCWTLLYVSETILHPYTFMDLLGSSWREGSPSLGILVGPGVTDSVTIGNDSCFYHRNSGVGAWDLYYVKA